MENVYDEKIQDISDKITRLEDKRCDCVLSIRCATTCSRCYDLQFYRNLLLDYTKNG
jgi:glutathione peroxidase-family protein